MDGLLEVGDGRWTTGTTCTSSSWGSSRISSGTRSGWRRPGEAGSSRGKGWSGSPPRSRKSSSRIGRPWLWRLRGATTLSTWCGKSSEAISSVSCTRGLVVEPWLDISESDGNIESYAKRVEFKTGHSLKKMGRRFPVVGWATGASGVPWAQAWRKLREVAGCDAEADATLMPEVLVGGEFGTSRMTTQDGTLILRELLRRAGIVEPRRQDDGQGRVGPSGSLAARRPLRLT